MSSRIGETAPTVSSRAHPQMKLPRLALAALAGVVLLAGGGLAAAWPEAETPARADAAVLRPSASDPRAGGRDELAEAARPTRAIGFKSEHGSKPEPSSKSERTGVIAPARVDPTPAGGRLLSGPLHTAVVRAPESQAPALEPPPTAAMPVGRSAPEPAPAAPPKRRAQSPGGAQAPNEAALGLKSPW